MIDEDNTVSSYLSLKNLEEKLREFIEQELSNSNPDWWKQRIPADVKENAENRKQKDELRKNWNYEKQPFISYIDFTDYEKIITQKNNWNDVFKHVFHDKNAISVKLKEIEPIRNSISHTRKLDSHEIKQIRFYSEEIIRSISYYLDNKPNINEERYNSEKSITAISVSFDRTVYPINSTIHIRINCPHPIPNESIMLEISNMAEEIIFNRNIAYDELPGLEITPDSGIYQISFSMNEKDWIVGETYVLKCIHGESEIFDATVIDARKPVIQSDKSVYLWGTDMLLTIIDPDADKDSQKVEFVGDRDDSKLIISSSKSKLENYRLRETGSSTGIFQGVVGFIGVNSDGKTKPYVLNNTSYSKTQGREVEDGFIEVSEKDEIEVNYYNGTQTTKLVLYVVKDPA